VTTLKPGTIMIDSTLQSAIEYITEFWDKDFSVADIAKKCCVSESTLYHLFQRNLGQTPMNFVNSVRINIAIEHLENSKYSISKISELVGFNSENHFRKIFFDFTGTTPLKFRKSR
ncbi:MAG: helix-turn-helix transcriptional regulator, partial [Clostridia bacterium]|nr:helix-turn-helix transcriptional regulator [Clostridia bacterium]